MFLSGSRAESQARQSAFYDDALTGIRSLPDVVAAGAAVTLPIGGDDFSVVVCGRWPTAAARGQQPSAGYQVVTPGYFGAMGIPVLAGRDFTAGDGRAAAPVAIVNHTLASREWPGAGSDSAGASGRGMPIRG